MKTYKLTHALYGKDHEVTFALGKYHNGNPSLEAFTPDGEPFMRCSVNPPYVLPEGQIAIKDWSENEGIDKDLQQLGIISKEPVDGFATGFVSALVYNLLVKDFK